MGLEKISKAAAQTLQEWLNDDRASALEHDPSTGIFRDDELAEAIQIVQSMIEEATGVPAP